MKRVVYTDLDGTLLDFSDYSYDTALPVLKILKKKNVPVVFCTAKTVSENRYYQKKTGINDPFIVENGGAIFIPNDYFSFSFECRKAGDYCVIELGSSYDKLRRALKEIRDETGFRIKGFGDMSVREVALDTRLSIEMAKLAKEKQYNESFIFDEAKEKEGILFRKIREKGFSVTHGGRYYNIHGKDASKGKAVRILSGLFEREFGKVETVGVGDSRNDISMLKAVSLPAVVKNNKGGWVDAVVVNLYRANGEGPKGWVEVMDKFIINKD